MANPWNPYIDTTMGYCVGNVDQVCIIGLKDGVFWTDDSHPANFKILQKEAKDISGAMNNESMQVGTMQASGIFLNGQKYRFLRFDDEEGLIVGKLKDHGSISIQKSGSAIVFAHTKEGGAQGTSNEGLKKMIDYLKQNNL